TNKEIARRMHLSARTVEGYRAGILKKAGAKNVTDLLPGCEPLTAREVDVLEHLAAGLTNKEIARRMHLSARTVEGYRAGILKKAGAKNVTDLLRRIFGQGSPTQA
ncbi:LuxR C-terminal-related transcriptional regulator, partial [Bradyrhizobium sp. PRIMUS42]|uniref:LuxR C-terminal-related transcriptional regulator n=1 Tax=Bradyrhizobium sp. PRIMUS42 TaxID=2908926 RepID=UPI001FF14291